MQRLHQKAYGEEIVGSGIDQGDPPTLERMLGQMYTTGDTKILSLTFEVRVDEELVDRRSFVAESVTIGAGPAAMLRVKSEHGTVADLHLVMNVNGDGTVQLLDLGSRAGTKLNGEAISNAGMKDGDRIGIGDDVEILVLFEQA